MVFSFLIMVSFQNCDLSKNQSQFQPGVPSSVFQSKVGMISHLTHHEQKLYFADFLPDDMSKINSQTALNMIREVPGKFILYESDGTPIGTRQLAKSNGVSGIYSTPFGLIVVSVTVTNGVPLHSLSLYKNNVVTVIKTFGVHEVIDLNVALVHAGQFMFQLTKTNDNDFKKLLRTDGTPEGTVELAGQYSSVNIVPQEGQQNSRFLYYLAGGVNGDPLAGSLMRVDSSFNSVKISDLHLGRALQNPVIIGDALYFGGISQEDARNSNYVNVKYGIWNLESGIWKFNFTTSNISALKVIDLPVTYSLTSHDIADSTQVRLFNQTLIFSTRVATYVVSNGVVVTSKIEKFETWKSDGTAQGTSILYASDALFNYPQSGSLMYGLFHNGILNVLDQNTMVYRNLVRDPHIEAYNCSTRNFINDDQGRFYLTCTSNQLGEELFVSDGINFNLVKDINTNNTGAETGGSSIMQLIRIPNLGIAFTAQDGKNPRSVWVMRTNTDNLTEIKRPAP